MTGSDKRVSQEKTVTATNVFQSVGSAVAVYLSLNIASAFSYALVARGVITKDDAAQILERIAASTLADAKSPEEKILAEPCAKWLRQVAETHKEVGANG